MLLGDFRKSSPDTCGEHAVANQFSMHRTSEEEEPDDHYFPLTLRTKKATDRPASPLDRLSLNGDA